MIVSPPMASRDALEKASAILRKGKCPPKLQADRIADALDRLVVEIVAVKPSANSPSEDPR